MVADWGRQQPWQDWQIGQIKIYKDLIKKAQDIDKKTGQPDCESPEKIAWEKELIDLKARLEKLEAKTNGSDVKKSPKSKAKKKIKK
jgi:hypothetical protein